MTIVTACEECLKSTNPCRILDVDPGPFNTGNVSHTHAFQQQLHKMKFSQDLATQIAKLPPSWRTQVIPYKPLKKSIKRIITAMQEAGITSLPRDATAIYSVAGDEVRLDSQLVLYVNDPQFMEKLGKSNLDVKEFDGTPIAAMQALQIYVDSPMLTAHDKGTWNEAAFLTRLEIERDERTKHNSRKPGRVSVRLEMGHLEPLEPLESPHVEANSHIPPRSSSLLSIGSELAEGASPARPADLMFSMEPTEPLSTDYIPPSFPPEFISTDYKAYQFTEYHSSGDETEEDREQVYSTSAPTDKVDWDTDDSNLRTPKLSSTLAPISAQRNRAHSHGALSPKTPRFSPAFDLDSPKMTATVAVVSSGKVYSPQPKSGKTFAMPLQADAEFLNQVSASLMQLSRFQTSVAEGIRGRIEELKRVLADVAGPGKRDIYAWREILGTYLESEIWETFGKMQKTAAQSEVALESFRSVVSKRHFKLMKSQSLLNEFLALSEVLFQLKLWSDINERAIYKILKKHDKRTNLAASVAFAKMFSQEPFFAVDLSRHLIQIVQEQFLAIVPQTSDYECVLCMEIAYKPIRLKCSHRFCHACLLKAQQAKRFDCPLCRSLNAVKEASADQLDRDMTQLLKMYFPKEIKAKEDERNEALLRAEQERLYRALTRRQGANCVVS